MKTFEHPNMSDFKCPICNTNEDKPVVFIPIAGTEEGNKHQAEQMHVECIDLTKILVGQNDEWWLVQKL